MCIRDSVSTFYHVVVGNDVTVLTDDDARTTRKLLLPRLWTRHDAHIPLDVYLGGWQALLPGQRIVGGH